MMLLQRLGVYLLCTLSGCAPVVLTMSLREYVAMPIFIL